MNDASRRDSDNHDHDRSRPSPSAGRAIGALLYNHVFPLDEFQKRTPDDLGRQVTHDPSDGGTDVLDDAGKIDDHD